MRNWKTFILSVALSPGLALAANTNKGANPNGKPFVELDGQIVEVEGEISSLQDQIDALVGRVDSVEDHQSAVTQAIADLEAANASLQAQIDANAADVASLEQQISDFNSDIIFLQDQIDMLGDADGALQAQIDANEARITTLSLAIDTLAGDLQTTIVNNNALIETMQDQLNAIDEHLAFTNNLLAGNCPESLVVNGIDADGNLLCVPDQTSSGSGGSIERVFVMSTFTLSARGRITSRFVYCPTDYFSAGNSWRHYTRNVRVVTNDNLGNGGHLSLINDNDFAVGGSLKILCLKFNAT